MFLTGVINVRRTKIVCTIGPASERAEEVRQLLSAGMDVARLNFHMVIIRAINAVLIP